MFNAKVIAFLLSLRAVFLSCCPQADGSMGKPQMVESYTRMEMLLTESSGLEYAGDGTFWTIRDSGGPAALYRISAQGQLLEQDSLPLKNVDWEELAHDSLGNLYIGDIGNNLNRRKNLLIYKYNTISKQLDTISFYWPEQTSFPPDKKNLNYDCEAFFWHKGALHLFTKSKGDKNVRHYSLPDQPGKYAATLLESAYINDLVTAADISPDGAKVALLTYGKVYLFATEAPAAMLTKPIGCIRIPWAGQSEALVFLNNQGLLISNETRKMFYVQL